MTLLENLFGGSSGDDLESAETLGTRSLSSISYTNNFTWNNVTDDDNFAFIAASDVSVDAVVTSIYLNAIAFVVIMASYECLRRVFPAVYNSKIKRQFKTGVMDPTDGESDDSEKDDSRHANLTTVPSRDRSLPDIFTMNWVTAVNSISWTTIRKYAGLDGYFFLRFIRMNLRICAVTTFWAFLILVPLYSTGTEEEEVGWYHLSAANVARGDWRMWVSGAFAYLFTGFIFFVMKQEYRHFLDLRMEFLARGNSHVIKQHHYSLLIENIPNELRSEKALYDYFDKLFPGKVHSASLILNLRDLEIVKARTLRVCRRLEKSIAHYHAVGTRPTHRVGSPRINILGVELAPFDWSCGSLSDVTYTDNRSASERPPRGTHVDSISYYISDLADCNKNMYFMQQRKTEIAFSGNSLREADNWLSRLMISAYEMANQIMIDSAEDNALRANYSKFEDGSGIPKAELMSSRYGSFAPLWHHPSQMSSRTQELLPIPLESSRSEEIMFIDENNTSASTGRTTSSSHTISGSTSDEYDKFRYKLPGKTQHAGFFRKMAGRLGLDFVVSAFKFANSQLDHAMESVVGTTMSSTGFVTFLDLTSVTCAATTPLTSKPQTLDVSVAPEPRDIIWNNSHVSAKTRARNERVVNFLVVVGVFFWIVPLSLIQAFAKAEYIARIPGMEWVLQSGSVSNFVNGYLPVVALLVLILILPLIFKFLAMNYERRMTYSDVQKSMLGRYFFYQVFNIYITVTAGSLWRSLGDILDHPSNLFKLLGESLPTMVGYFVALLVTKILAGLPMVFLRVGAFSRMLLLRSLSTADKLTQRELDEIYRPENVQYGWEFPSQMLVIMIVFTYAIISPIILPVGMCYFIGSLIVYKKQVLYVYQPVYESGGATFPFVLQRTLFGLILGQLTFIGYLITRGFFFQPIFLLPLPLISVWGLRFFNHHYAEPSKRLSLERAREYDKVTEMLGARVAGTESRSDFGIEARRTQFTKDSYRQPVLTQKAMEPKAYRKGQRDPLTEESRTQLKDLQEYALMHDPSHASSD